MFVVIKNIVLNIYSFLLYYVHVQCMYVLAAFVYAMFLIIGVSCCNAYGIGY